jgi:uncharacterized protein (DUF3084 family)
MTTFQSIPTEGFQNMKAGVQNLTADRFEAEIESSDSADKSEAECQQMLSDLETKYNDDKMRADTMGIRGMNLMLEADTPDILEAEFASQAEQLQLHKAIEEIYKDIVSEADKVINQCKDYPEIVQGAKNIRTATKFYGGLDMNDDDNYDGWIKNLSSFAENINGLIRAGGGAAARKLSSAF